MGSSARPLHDAGNDRTLERRSHRQVACRGCLTIRPNPPETTSDPALTPSPGARSGDANTCGTSSACGDANALFTLYNGATYEAPINGMYSFVPCRRAD